MDIAVAEAGKARRDAFEELADIALAARWFAKAAPVGAAPPAGGRRPARW